VSGRETIVPLVAESAGIGSSTMPATVAAAVERYGHRPWLAHDGITHTFAELGTAVDDIAAALMAAGIGHDDGVALFMGNRVEWLEVEFGVVTSGAWMVPLNTYFKAGELTHILASSGCRALVWDATVLGRDTRPLLDELVPELRDGTPGRWQSAAFPRLELVVGVGDGPWPPGVTSWDAFLARGSTVSRSLVRARAGEVQPEDAGLILYTSGTTGTPRGAMLSNTGIVDHMREWTRQVDLGPDDRSVMASPLFWVFGCTMNAMVPLHAGSMVVLEDRFEAKQFLTDIEDFGCTHLQGVPEQYELALNHPDSPSHDLSTLSVVQIGGSASAADLALRILERAPGARMLSAYGLTEAVGVNTWTEFDDPLELLTTSIGHASPDNAIELRDPETTEEVAAGEVGEIWIRGNHVSKGYIGDPEGTAATFVDGWLRTGDLARADERGYYTIAGRRSHTYKRGGMNVYPVETEVLLASHPAVERASIVGVPDERLGQVGAAFVVLVPGAELSEQELLDWADGRLASYKLPAYVRIVDALPTTASGKVRKFELQEAWAREMA
jgi:acyl-CoA synthetase (AMP-forming)/AMP-acid ligase II